MTSLIHKLFAFYLPRRLRRWFIYIPLNTVGLFCVFTLAVIIKAAGISTDPLYTQKTISSDVSAQLKHMDWIMRRSADQSKLDIYTQYTEVCGKSLEWDYGFYVFYALCLDSLVQQYPEQRAKAAEHIDLCARLLMQLPIGASESEIASILKDREIESASLITGYKCVVLCIRESIIKDHLYNQIIAKMADELTKELNMQLVRCSSVYTSDQSTQLHAIWRSDQILGSDHSILFSAWLNTMRSKFLDPEHGLLYSLVSIGPDKIDSPPRSTSIAWSIIFLKDIYPEFAEQQFAALQSYRVRRFVNLSAISEYPDGNLLNFGDLDSGPMILGLSPSATGFGICAQKLYGNQDAYTRTYRLFEIFGWVKEDETGKYYRMGNGMGDAILLYSKIVEPES